MAVRGPGSRRCLVQHSENGSIPSVLMRGKVFAPMFYCNVYYGTEADGGNPPLIIHSKLQHNIQPSLAQQWRASTLLSSAVACLHSSEDSRGI